MGLARPIFAADQYSAFALQTAEIKSVFAVEWAKVFYCKRVNIDFCHD